MSTRPSGKFAVVFGAGSSGAALRNGRAAAFAFDREGALVAAIDRNRAEAEPIHIGRGSNIQDNSVVHTDPGAPAFIGVNVSIGHGAILHGCTIEDGALIGMGAVVMNGAVVGAGSLLAAGTVVTQGTVIPAGSLVAGVPAAVKRSLNPAAIEANLDNARHYIELARTHRGAIANR